MAQAVAEHMKQGIAPRTRTIERGPDGRVRKGFSPPSEDIKLWRESREREDGDDVEVTMVRVPVSSTGKDRDGDRFSEEGLEHMAEQLRSGEVPMYPNHGLDPETGWPEYRFEHQMGGWKDAEIEADGDTKVVYATAALSPESEEAAVLERQIENGVVPVSFSVGFMPHNSDAITDEEGDPVGREFHEHDLFETSAVGIPSNTDATIAATARAAAKGAAAVRGIDDPEALERLANQVEAEVKTGSSIDSAIEERLPTKQSDDELQTTENAIGDYLTEGGSEDDPVADFLSWAEETNDDEELAAIQDVVSAWLETVDGDADSEPVETLLAWVEDQQGTDADEGDEGGSGEEEDSIGVEDVRSIVREELDPLKSRLEDVAETVATERSEEAQAEIEQLRDELQDVRDEMASLEEENEELQRRLDQADVKEPKGRGAGRTITQATRDQDGTDSQQTEQRGESPDDVNEETEELAQRIKKLNGD